MEAEADSGFEFAVFVRNLVLLVGLAQKGECRPVCSCGRFDYVRYISFAGQFVPVTQITPAAWPLRLQVGPELDCQRFRIRIELSFLMALKVKSPR